MSDPNVTPPPSGYQPPQPGYQPAPAAAPLTSDQEKQYSFWAHLGGIVGILPSLIIFLVFKDRSQPANPIQVRHEAKEALNWQITLIIAWVAVWIVVSILSGILFAAAISADSGALLGFISFLGLIPWALWIYNIVISIVAGVRVNGGQTYRYPVTFRFIK